MEEQFDEHLDWVIMIRDKHNKETYYCGYYETNDEGYAEGEDLIPKFSENYRVALKCKTQAQANAIGLGLGNKLYVAYEVKSMISGIPKINKATSLDEPIFTALGEASMCWSEEPKGEFDNAAVNIIADKLIGEIVRITGYKI